MGKFSRWIRKITGRPHPWEIDRTWTPTPGFDLMGISVDTSARCNLQCTTCSLDGSYDEKGIMSLDSFRRLLDVLPKLKHIAFSNSAEPLMNKNLIEMIRIAKKSSRGRIVTAFTTNGMLLDETRIRSLIKVGLDALEFSMDGATPKTFEHIRKGASYDKVLQNIKQVITLKKKLKRWNPHLSLRFVLFKDNAHELSPFIDLAHELGIEQVVVNGLEPYTHEMADKVLYSLYGNYETDALFQEISEKASRYGMRLDLPSLIPDVVDDCLLVSNTCILLWDGTVIPCSSVAYKRPFYYFGEFMEHPQVSFGNINKTSLIDIWNSEAYKTFRANLKEGKLPDYCQTCLHRAGVVCPLEHWKWLGLTGTVSKQPEMVR